MESDVFQHLKRVIFTLSLPWQAFGSEEQLALWRQRKTMETVNSWTCEVSLVLLLLSRRGESDSNNAAVMEDYK